MFLLLPNARFQPIFVGICLAAFAALVLIAEPLLAGSGNVTPLPMPGRKLKNKLILEVDCQGVDANGYRPVRIKGTNITKGIATGPTTAERTIQITVYVNRYEFNGHSQSATGKLEFAVGATTAETKILVPQNVIWQQVSVDVYEDGNRLEDLSGDPIYMRRNNWTGLESSPSVLFIDRNVLPLAGADRAAKLQNFNSGLLKVEPTYDLPDFRQLMQNVPRNNYYGQTPQEPNTTAGLEDYRLMNLIADYSQLELAPFEELPTNWLELSCYDLIVISLEDLQTLSEKHPARFAAVREWLSTGPVLCVSGVGDDYENLGELENLLKLSSLPKAKKYPKYLGWSWPDGSLPTTNVLTTDGYYDQNGQLMSSSRVGAGAAISSTKANPAKWADDPPFLFRKADLGCLAALPMELNGQVKGTPGGPTPGGPAPVVQVPIVEWRLLLNATSQTHWRWSTRHNIASGENRWYWQFMIPGVGMAPVISFVFLITLFMILIGPVNYWLVRRLQRTYLLLITVPAGAAIVTLSLFIYALATEGLRVNSRLRSFTQLDNANDRATTVARHSYYASLTPSGGLVFPSSAAAFPLEPVRNDYDHKSRVLRWEEDGQRLKSGYLYPRTVSQFMLVQPYASTAHLKVTGKAGAEDGRTVANGLGCRIQRLIVCDEGDILLTADDIAAGESAALVSKPQGWNWDELFKDSEPKDIKDFDPASGGNLWTWIFPFPMYGNGASIDPEESLLESNLKAVSHSGDLKLRPGEFVAIVDRPEEVAIGIKRSREVAGFHVMRGNWQP